MSSPKGIILRSSLAPASPGLMEESEGALSPIPVAKGEALPKPT